MPHATPLIATIVGSLALAFILGAIAQRLRISPLVGYLLAGVVVGPFTPGYVADQGLALELSEIGVILLMFGVGLHFHLHDLIAVKAIAIPGALGQSAVENNLTVMRTGRDEARITLDSRLVRRLGAFVEGRFRYRTLLGAGGDPDVFQQPLYKGNTQNIAGDATVGLRDTGSIAGIRAGLSYSAILDFRATNHVITFDIGRDFWHERIGATLNYVAAITRDKLANNESVGCFSGGGSASSATDGPFYNCFGQRSGMTHELGLQGTVNPFRTLFFLLDYRLIATTTDGQNIAGTITPLPTVLGHSILGRVEYRW